MVCCFFLPLFLLLLTQFPANTCSLCDHHDNYALRKFKNSFVVNTSYERWSTCYSNPSKKIESWNNGTDCCEWDGVTCNTVSGHVIGLDLSCSGLEGKLSHNSTIFQLKQLRQLNLAYNDFLESPIYYGIGDLVSLTHLNLSFTRLSGNIPSTISHLSKLISLDLSGSMRLDPFTWKRLMFNATNLRQLHLDDVDMSLIDGSSLSQLMNLSSSLVSLSLAGTGLQGNFPSDILSLANLQELELSSNQNLSGQLPQFNWSTPLRYLDLSYTAFSGEIPYSIGKLKSLTQLTLMECYFDGLLPLSLGNLTQLTSLILTDNNLTGVIPQCLGTFPSLTIFDMQMNNLYRSIPRNFSKENSFQTIKLNANRLEGPIPQSLARCTKLEVLDLGDNNIDDTFPNWLETLQELQVLILRSNELHGLITCSSTKHPFPKLRIYDVSGNNFSGPLPTSCFKNFQGMMNVIDNQTGLQYIGVANYYNDSVVVTIKGNIPHSLSYLRNLEWLDLSRNKLRGQQFNTFGNDSYGGNTMLCGFPLSKSCKNDEDRSPYSTSNDEEESGFGWKAVVIGYGCGSILGMLLGYNVFFNGKPQWLSRLVESIFSIRLKRTNNRAGANGRRMN
ncbi:hypothetical protein TSUD_171430 [Trifolium subterraneum]|uniref:Leucine-rich repeat-containing N-terminal plant-type domain-containing protein n=1 Tax=Trifolium subterraneum TaxID=3900 RepID=A0A2Z6LKK8_TRISU|nr:hypothetical protein TSUD_171430 [Trifolium subterraneum]